MRNLEHDAHVVVTAGPLGADGWGGQGHRGRGSRRAASTTWRCGQLADEWRTKYDGDWVFEARDGRFFEVSDQGDGGMTARSSSASRQQGAGLRRRARADDVPVLAVTPRSGSLGPEPDQPAEVGEELLLLVGRVRRGDGLAEQPVEVGAGDPLEDRLGGGRGAWRTTPSSLGLEVLVGQGEVGRQLLVVGQRGVVGDLEVAPGLEVASTCGR